MPATAIAVERTPGNWYVFWESESAYGSRGDDLSEGYARRLAELIEESGNPEAVLGD